MTEAAAREDRLRKELEEGYPESWKPSAPGETLIGIFRGRDSGQTPYGPKWIVTLQDADGKRWGVWLLHTALESQFRRAQPAIGEMIAVRYEGKAVSKDGKNTSYDNWTVRVDRPDQAVVDWNTPVSGGHAAPAAPPSDQTVPEGSQPPPFDDSDIPF